MTAENVPGGSDERPLPAVPELTPDLEPGREIAGASDDTPTETETEAPDGATPSLMAADDEDDSEAAASRARTARDWGLMGLYGAIPRSVTGNAVRAGRDAVGRDVVHGSIYNLFGAAMAPGVVAGPVHEEVLQRLRQVHVPRLTGRRDDGGQLRSQLNNGARLVVLTGRRSSGRRHAALVTLDIATSAGNARADRPLRLLPAGTPLSALTAETFRVDARGYVMDATGASWVAAADPAVVAEVVERLEAGSSVLVVLSDDATPALPHVVAHSSPDPHKVLESHLAAELAPGGDETAGQVLELAQRFPHVAAACDRLRQPWNAVAVAKAVAEWRRRTSDDPSAVPNPHPFQRAEALHRAQVMLRGTNPAESTARAQSFIVSGAVLDGVAVSRVIDASHHLTRLFQRAGADEGPTAGSLFAEPLRRWLHHVEVSEGTGDEGGLLLTREQGVPPPAEGGLAVVRLLEPSMAGVVLDVLWTEYDQARTPVLQWLSDLCAATDDRVRVLAALAMGKLATLDFDSVSEKVFHPWADDRNRGQVLAWALESVVVDGRLAERVLQLLDEWTGSNYARRAVAIRAYGTSIGALHPDTALNGIERAFRGHPFMGRLVDRSLVEIHLATAGPQVVERLAAWADQAGRYRARAGSCLLRLANFATERPDAVHRPDLIDRIPDDELRQRIVDLWAAALADPTVHGDAWTLLGKWRALGHQSWPDVARFARDVLEAAGGRPEIRRRLAFYERLWDSQLQGSA